LKCGNEVDVKTAPRVLLQGRTYYFCSEEDRAEFVKNPGKFGVEASSTPSVPAHAH
jgi:YHS domain-containing protein